MYTYINIHIFMLFMIYYNYAINNLFNKVKMYAQQYSRLTFHCIWNFFVLFYRDKQLN